MTMKTTRENPISPEALENELKALEPWVRQALSCAVEPSPRVIRAIHNEAVRQVEVQRRKRRFIPFFRTLAAAATLALLLGGAFQIHTTRLEGINSRAIGHILNLGAAHAPDGMATSSSAELANRLLAIQGLDDENFLMHSEEAESLLL